MRRALYSLPAVIAVAYLGLCGALYALQGSLLYFPAPRSVTARESTLLLPVAGAELVVSVRPHAGSKAIVYFGGNGEDVSLNLASFAKAFPEHALFLLHYRGFGGSTGTPTEEDNQRDAAALLATVQAQHPDVVVIGRSLGSGVAVRLASHSAVSRLVLVTPFDSIVELAAAAYPFAPVRWLLRDRYESGKYAPSIRVPTTIFAADDDEVVPRASTEKLLARFGRGVASMTIVPGTGHNTIVSTSAYLAALQAAVNEIPPPVAPATASKPEPAPPVRRSATP